MSARYDVVLLDEIGRYAWSSQNSEVSVVKVPVTWAVPPPWTENDPFRYPVARVSTRTDGTDALPTTKFAGPITLTSTMSTRSNRKLRIWLALRPRISVINPSRMETHSSPAASVGVRSDARAVNGVPRSKSKAMTD